MQHLRRRLVRTVAVLGAAAVPALAPGVAAAGEPGTTWDPVQAIQCAQLKDELDGYEQDRNHALEVGDTDAAQAYEELAEENMAEQESWDCNAQFLPGGLPGQIIDRTRGALTPGVELGHLDPTVSHIDATTGRLRGRP